MSRAVEVVRGVATRPIEAIEAVIALTLFCFGLYLVSPFYVITATAAIAATFGEDYLLRALTGAVLYVLPSLPTLLSLFIPHFDTPTWRTRANLGMFVGVSFLTLLRLISVGLFPLTWLFTLGLGLISAICYLHWKAK